MGTGGGAHGRVLSPGRLVPQERNDLEGEDWREKRGAVRIGTLRVCCSDIGKGLTLHIMKVCQCASCMPVQRDPE